MNNYVYILDGKAYVNLTNKCHNACEFCIRNTGDGVGETPLWLSEEPTASDVIAAFSRLQGELKSDEVVFCGFGEPTEALEVLKDCASFFKAAGYKTRLNTNGLGSLVAGRDIAAELAPLFDTVSVSLNDHNAEKYAALTRSRYGLDAFQAVLHFAEACKAAGANVVFTVVDTIGEEDVAACKRLCEEKGIPLRVREYIADNYKGERK